MMPIIGVQKPQKPPYQAHTTEQQATFTTISTYLGFSAALIAITLFFVKTSQEPQQQSLSVLVLALVILILLLASRCNDFLIKQLGSTVIRICALVGILSQIALVLSGFNLIFAPLTALWITALVLLWANHLINQPHRTLLLITAIAAVITGAFLTFTLDLSINQIMFLMMAVALISSLSDFLINHDAHLGQHNQSRPIRRATSLQHLVNSNSNNFTIIALGLAMGITLVLSGTIQFEQRTTTLILGGVTVLASLVTLLFRERYPKVFEHLARRTLAVFMSCALLLYPFFNTPGQMICVCLLLLTVAPNTIILIDAIVETALLKSISPYLIVGRQGTLYLLGILVGEIGFLYSLRLEVTQLLTATCVIAALTFIVLQVFIENQSYPFCDSNLADDDAIEEDNNAVKQSEQNKGGGGIWTAKLNKVASRNKLSPRQIEVMRLLAKGRGIKYITDYFAISRATAKTHIYNLYRKLEVHSRQDMLDIIEQEPLDNQDAETPSKDGGSGQKEAPVKQRGTTKSKTKF
ncbi:MAG: helix-turn-helix transcriptional regulator [Coriobacteriales bacterium]|jgi:DNA-binding CsgD family transcriptional regulator|nr:helix-turn-helix transcriptional regulator [Coriobacteriales bacterium]